MVFNGLRGVKNLRSKIENLVFIEPRQIPLSVVGEETICERPLRGMTAQGPRTALARSEELQPGTYFECIIRVFGDVITENILRDLLSYGAQRGFGQWRNGGHGRFTFELSATE